MRKALGLVWVCVFASSYTIAQTPRTPQASSIEACAAGLTEAGRGSSFQGTAIFEAEVVADGSVVSVRDLRVPEVFPIFVQMAEFKACVKRWKFRGAGAVVVAFTAGTTGETLRRWSISVGNREQGVVLVLPRGAGS